MRAPLIPHMQLQFAGDGWKRYNISFRNWLSYHRTCRIGQWFEYSSGREESLARNGDGKWEAVHYKRIWKSSHL